MNMPINIRDLEAYCARREALYKLGDAVKEFSETVNEVATELIEADADRFQDILLCMDEQSGFPALPQDLQDAFYSNSADHIYRKIQAYATSLRNKNATTQPVEADKTH